MAYCPNCGEEVKESQEFCDSCGANLLDGSNGIKLPNLPKLDKSRIAIIFLVLIAGVLAFPVEDTKEVSYNSEEPYTDTETYTQEELITREVSNSFDFFTDRLQPGETQDFYNEDDIVASAIPYRNSEEISDDTTGDLEVSVSTEINCGGTTATTELRRAEQSGNFNSCYASPEEGSYPETLDRMSSGSGVVESDNLASGDKYCVVVEPSESCDLMESEISMTWTEEETVQDTEPVEKEREVTKHRNVTKTKEEVESVPLLIYLYRNLP